MNAISPVPFRSGAGTETGRTHDWDDSPHAIRDDLEVEAVELGDVILETLQVDGLALANHAGKPAIRLDLSSVVGDQKGRLVLQYGAILNNVKRYTA